ncbi:hypothetical protein GCM10009530_62680 [Microbispora corallina]|uniref:Lipoprotein n=1 Tax=Microbispora corallina TaxID=83302 RepID=A0ABQ4G7P4_9ACTN|nr:hypothetical protein [Microbispora corallina]GIH43091.1 hypothetical protein Mco01_60910 [Microbispora corallina]
MPVARKFSPIALAFLVGATTTLICGGCSINCETSAKKYFAIVREATRNSFGTDEAPHRDEMSGCDSWDDPAVLIPIRGQITSAAEVSTQMKADHWEPLSKQEAKAYGGEVALRKRVQNQVLIAIIGETQGAPGKQVEVIAGD